MGERDAGDEGKVYDGVPAIGLPLKQVSSSLVRDWVRSALVPSALERLYKLGMGQLTFATPTQAGNVVHIEAPPAVQRAALRDVIAVGVPQSVGLTGEGDALPGVLAMGEFELQQARSEVHARRVGDGSNGTIGERIDAIADEIVEKVLGTEYVAPEGHEVVEITESATSSADDRAAEPPPPVDPDRNALAREFLARRLAAKQGRVSTNGSHPNHT
jgi:hypothetical protein